MNASITQEREAPTPPAPDDLTTRLAKWIDAEKITGDYPAQEIAARVITATGPAQVEHWLACGDRDHGGSSYIVTFLSERESTFSRSGTAHLRHACLSLPNPLAAVRSVRA